MGRVPYMYLLYNVFEWYVILDNNNNDNNNLPSITSNYAYMHVPTCDAGWLGVLRVYKNGGR